MKRRVVIVTIALIASWYAMMMVHELGHVIAAWVTGSRVETVRVPWFGFSQTVVSTSDWPRAIVVGGPAFGAVAPLGVWLATATVGRLYRSGWSILARFFAAFCLLANGVYMASAVLLPVGDAEELIRLGVRAWTLAVPGGIAAAGGLALWNGMSRKIGGGCDGHSNDEVRGPRSESMNLTHAISMLAAVVGFVCVVGVAGH